MAYDGTNGMPPIISYGTSAVIYALDDFRVLKTPSGFNDSHEDFMIECRIYERLRGHPGILNFHRHPRGLILERLLCPLREYLRHVHGQGLLVSAGLVLKWAGQVVNSLWSMHSKGVLHANIGCHKLLLHSYYDIDGQSQLDLKFCDFGGASIDGAAPTVRYEIRSRHQSIRGPMSNLTTELFALGTMLYELSTLLPPHPMVFTDEGDDSIVQNLYTLGGLPRVEHLMLGKIISGCWLCSYESILDVAFDMQSIRDQYRPHLT